MDATATTKKEEGAVAPVEQITTESPIPSESSNETSREELDDSISPGESADVSPSDVESPSADASPSDVESPSVVESPSADASPSTESSPTNTESSLSSVMEPDSQEVQEVQEEMFIKEGEEDSVSPPQVSLTENKDEDLLHEAELFRVKINKSSTLKKYFKMPEKNKTELRNKLIKNYMNVLRISTRKNLTDKHHKLIHNIRNTFNRRLNSMDKMRKRKTKSKSKKQIL